MILLGEYFTCFARNRLQLGHVADDDKAVLFRAPFCLPIEDFFELGEIERSDVTHVKEVGLLDPGQLFAEAAYSCSVGQAKKAFGRARHPIAERITRRNIWTRTSMGASSCSESLLRGD